MNELNSLPACVIAEEGESRGTRLVALELQEKFSSQEHYGRFRAALKPFEDKYNIEFILLDKGITISWPKPEAEEGK